MMMGLVRIPGGVVSSRILSLRMHWTDTEQIGYQDVRLNYISTQSIYKNGIQFGEVMRITKSTKIKHT